MEETQPANQLGRDALVSWQKEIAKNIYSTDQDFIHSVQFHVGDNKQLIEKLTKFGALVPNELELLVEENNMPAHLPRLESYNAVGERVDHIVHHPTYQAAGNIIYGTGLLKNLTEDNGLSACLTFLFMSSQAGEAGHNCPIACSAGIMRILQKVTGIDKQAFYLEKLTQASYDHNFTGAQFLTEIQGGSDVGLNACYAVQEQDHVWRIYGEKWFCSNAGADLILMTARYAADTQGTKGLGLFLVPAQWENKKNDYTIRRLKDKIGTRSMATGEIDFHGAYGIAMGPPSEGFHLVMDNVLNISRLFNTFSVLGMARRAYRIANAYAQYRIAFGQPIIHYPLVKQTLAQIKAENSAMLAAAYATTILHDQFDAHGIKSEDTKLLLRLLVNFLKIFSPLQHTKISITIKLRIGGISLSLIYCLN